AWAQPAGQGFDVELALIGHAEGLGDHVPLRMVARLLVRDGAAGHQFLHVAVVLRELAELAVAPQIDAAVAYPRHFEAPTRHAGRHHGGAPGQGVPAAARGADDFLVGNADGLRERGARAHVPHDGLPCQRAGDLAIVMAAHAARHHPQAPLAVTVGAGLVELAPRGEGGQVSEIDQWRAIVASAAPGSLATSTESSLPWGHRTSGANAEPGAGPGSSLSACL